MKLNNILSQEAEYIGDVQENRVGIDKSNIDFITTLLTSNLYSDPLGSFLRETVSNAYDSHMEAGTEEHILLLIEDTGKYEEYRISIRDYGVGVSPERFEKIYRNIGSSTKRESNDYIGMFGIGRFSCLSCADVAHITSYYQGTKYSYVMYKNGGGINIDKISETKGDFKDGLEVSIEMSITPWYKLTDAIHNLCLFDKLHIVYKGGHYQIKLSVNNFNNRTVSHFKTFSKCSLQRSSYNYYKVGNVLYECKKNPLDSACGIIIDLPMGSVDITPNRENLQYTKYTEDSIQRQTALVKEELKSLVEQTLAKNLSLEGFCKDVAFDSQYHIRVDGVEYLYISKTDVTLDESLFSIEKEQIPPKFIKFLRSIKDWSIPKELVTKTTVGGETPYRRGYMASKELRYALRGDIDIVEKEDKVTKGVTWQWHKKISQKSCFVLTHDALEDLKHTILDLVENNYKNILSRQEAEKCWDFTIRHLHIRKLSNDSVPTSFIKEYREEQKSKRTKEVDGSMQIRWYNPNGYMMERIERLPKKGIIVYSPNVVEYRHLTALSILSGGSSNIAAVISARKDQVGTLKGSKRFVDINEFMFLRNKIISKLVTANIIMENISKSLKDYPPIPIFREFQIKYKKELKVLNTWGATTNEHLQDLCKYYKEKGWVNQCDIKYFSLNQKELDSLKDWETMKINRDVIVQRMALKKHGMLPKIGLVNIKKITLNKEEDESI